MSNGKVFARDVEQAVSIELGQIETTGAYFLTKGIPRFQAGLKRVSRQRRLFG